MRERREDEKLNAAIRRSALPLTGDHTEFDPLVRLIGDSRFVLIGEASHGTHHKTPVRGKGLHRGRR